MFRRYPYWGWLLISIALWGCCLYAYHGKNEATQARQLAQLVERDVKSRIAAYQRFVNDPELLKSVYEDSVSEAVSKRLQDEPFYIFAYSHDTLKYWNTNAILASAPETPGDQFVLTKNENGIFLERGLAAPGGSGGRRVVVLIPMKLAYPQENNYLHSRFVAGDEIPADTRILPVDSAVMGAFPVVTDGGKPLFYAKFGTAEGLKWVPGPFFLTLMFLAICCSLLWVQLMIIYVSRQTSDAAGLMLTACVIGILLFLFYTFPLPFNLRQLPLFDPQLYASNKVFSSFGALIIDTFFLLWLVIFLAQHPVLYRVLQKVHIGPWRLVVAAFLIAGLFYCYNGYVLIIRSLVSDSNISFDVSHFYAINFFSILGLAVIGTITGIFCVLIYLVHNLLNMLIATRRWKWLLIVLISLAGLALSLNGGLGGMLVTGTDKLFLLLVYGWLLLFLFFLDLPRFTLVTDLFEPHMVFWAIYICLLSAGTIQHYNLEKERNTRTTFVKAQLTPQRDYQLEFMFQDFKKTLQKDKLLHSFMAKPTAAGRKALDKRLYSQVLPPVFPGKYQPRIFLFDEAGRALFNKDPVSLSDLEEERSRSEQAHGEGLYYQEGIPDQHLYLGFVPLGIDSGASGGMAVVDVDSRQEQPGTVYPELLQPSDHMIADSKEYAIGYYLNGRLADQTGDYAFAPRLPSDTLSRGDDFSYLKRNQIMELYSRISDKLMIAVVHFHSELIEIITLFSYLFVIQVALAGIVIMYQLYLMLIVTRHRRRVTRFNLRRRVHFSMLGVVLLSFILIGAVTVVFFRNQYHQNNADKLQAAMAHARQDVRTELVKERALIAGGRFDTVARTAAFKSLLNSIARVQKIDLNLYNTRGVLVNTSEDDIYEKGLIAPLMRPDALYQMKQAGKSILIQEEQISGLRYLSAYLALRDEQGITSGYLNVPFFSSEKELRYQISNIVVTLINLYAFIFLLSGLLAVFVTRWITSTFNIIGRQFGKLNLERNERISWPYEDEIGVLVAEYNKMVDKVEGQAAALAQSERETAWREMARQVAHEIKNPLTPMKLNLQYLQRAIYQKTDLSGETIIKLTGTIIEEIDNLAYIANEFSSFAKLPEAQPEMIEPAELLEHMMRLYSNDARVRMSLQLAAPPGTRVYCDRSQLMRVLTNLMENAYQSLPEEGDARITLGVQKEADTVVLWVADTGSGIPEEVRSKIFQPYFTTRSSGTGLGLAMTRKIIEFWKGTIWFETEVQKGTTFFVRLPVASA